MGVALLLQSVTSQETVFRVRNLHGHREVLNERQREIFELQLTFSKEGDPIDLPMFYLQVFPTPIPLDVDSEMGMERALADFFKIYFDVKYPQLEDDIETSSPQFNSATVDIVEMRTITSQNTRNRKLQRQGTEFDIRTVLRFDYGVFPDYAQLKDDIQSVFDDFNLFLTDFLPAYTTTSLQLIDSGLYISGFTDPPTTSPTTTIPPSAPPTADTARNTVSEINQNAQINKKNGDGLGGIYPALICGVIVFLLTVLWLSYGRRKVADIESDEYSVPTAAGHISVDFDGRQEALDLEKDRHFQHQMQQEILEQYQNEEIAQQLRTTKRKNHKRPWHISGGHIQSERMEDGRTTIHISPEMAEDAHDAYEDEDEDEKDVDDADSADNADDTKQSTSRKHRDGAVIYNVASSMEDSSYYDNGRSLFCATGSSDFFGDSSVRYSQVQQQRTPLPSMSKGDAEFGRVGSL